MEIAKCSSGAEDDFEEALVKVEPNDFHTATTIERPKPQMAAPMTPRANRAEHVVTTGKRKHNEMEQEPPPSDRMPRLNLLDSGYHGGEASERPSKRRAVDYEFLDQISTQSSPTPARYRNAESAVIENTLFENIRDALTPHGIRLDELANHSVQQVCTRYQQKSQGLSNGLEISRLALRAREAKISELQLRIQTLDAELATKRAIVKHLRETGEDDHL